MAQYIAGYSIKQALSGYTRCCFSWSVLGKKAHSTLLRCNTTEMFYQDNV